MPKYSLLTLVKGRQAHLENLLRGVAAQQSAPCELIIIHINEKPYTLTVDPGVVVRQFEHWDTDHVLPLAAARNAAAVRARGDILCFLDVDCIPHPGYLVTLGELVEKTGGLVMGDVRYLPKAIGTAKWTIEELEEQSASHPRRPILTLQDHRVTDKYYLFWSLCFGIHSTDFKRLGGFDERYTGYGGEDTDFAFTAQAKKLSFYLSGARVYHQHHTIFSPPYNHFKDIVVNAREFYGKWQRWPMEKWLSQFAQAGLIDWQEGSIEIKRSPSTEELEASRTDEPFV